MSRWYRAYEGTVTDAKIGEAALVAGCTRSVAIAAWHCLLESCTVAQRGGEFDTTPRRVAVILAEPPATIEALFAAFTEIGMIGNGAVTAWKQRQFESDTSTERSRKHRERKRSGDATLQQRDEALPNGGESSQQRDATPPDTYTETDTDTYTQEACVREGDPEHWKVVQDILENRSDALNPWEDELLTSIKWAFELSKAQRDKLKAIRDRLQAGEGKVLSMWTVVRGSLQYDAWIAYFRQRGNAKFYESRDTFTVPTEFPPAEKAA